MGSYPKGNPECMMERIYIEGQDPWITMYSSDFNQENCAREKHVRGEPSASYILPN
jgi:hypothetical protein